MLNVRDLLKMKGDEIWAISPETVTVNALRLMAEKNIGALLVMEENILSGIITERDFVHRVSKDQHCLLDEPVETYMTHKVITVTPDQTIADCMKLMSEKHIRHLPVVDGDKLVGLISMRDVVEAIIGEQSSMIRSLENYITGVGYGQ